MKYEITSKQLDNVLRPYFEKYFTNSVYDTKKNQDGDLWTGYWQKSGKNYDLLIGYPFGDNANVWFYNGQILQGQLYYGIDNTEFIDSIKRYLMDVYGERIETIV